MFYPKIIALIALSAACVSAIPNPAVLARVAEDEIYARDMAKLGLARREDHPSPEMVAREVEDVMRRGVTNLLTRMPGVVCSTIMGTAQCHSDGDCTAKSLECTYCKPDGQCDFQGPTSWFSSDSSDASSSSNSGGSGNGASSNGRTNGASTNGRTNGASNGRTNGASTNGGRTNGY